MADRLPEPISPMPDEASNYEKLIWNLIPRVIKHLGVGTADGMFAMMELVEVYNAILGESDDACKHCGVQIAEATLHNGHKLWIHIGGTHTEIGCGLAAEPKFKPER